MRRARGVEYAHFQSRKGKRGTSHRIYWNHPTEGKQFSPWYKDINDAHSMAVIVNNNHGAVLGSDPRVKTHSGIRNGWDAPITVPSSKTSHKDTLAYWHERAIATSVAKGRRSQTIKGYWAVHKQLAPFHNWPVSTWTMETSATVRDTLAQTVAKRTGEPLTARTVNTAMVRVFSALRRAHRDGFIATVPDHPAPLKTASVGHAITPEQSVAIAKNMRDLKARVFIGTQVLTGMRPGELAALRKNDLRENNRIRVDETINRSGERVGPTKTGESRTITVHERVWASLAKLGAELTETDFLFSRGDGKRPPSHESYRKYWREAVALTVDEGYAIPPNLRLHDLRHTAGSWLHDAGMPAAYAALRQGQSLATYSATYAHAGDDVNDRMASALADRLADQPL